MQSRRLGWVLSAAAVGISVFTIGTQPARAVVHAFDLDGKHADGMHSLNETHSVTVNNVIGGEVGAGITYDDVSNILDINIAWGSANGFTDLSANASDAHIHGPTASPAPAGFNEAAGVAVGIFSLAGFNSSATAGGFDGTVTLNATQETQLMNSQYYINIHTSNNVAGELRGHLVLVPEPTAAALLLPLAVGVAVRRGR